MLHLMIASRLHWKAPGVKIPGGKGGLAAFDFSTGALTLTEAGTKKRASLHVVRTENLAVHNPGGLEPLDATADQFLAALRLSNHTLKRALTNPRLFAGIGNAYSDEILHAARLSPIALTQKITDEEASISSPRHRRRFVRGSRAYTNKRATDFPRRSPPSALKWPPTDAMDCRAPTAAPPSSASAMPTTKRTIAPCARPTAMSSPTAPSHGC
ncbi:MAG: hypothetical protein KF861_01060 [Planctomycetaceae bacterium]|nr:hypothetical protein [Planctomycetaceae bacterium]